ncbi:hypothetical protein SAMN02799625_04666 [Methylobacterium sp. UNC300MFChir4.1]|uniref:hypothetical protein n=1 Tax=Methylobacterium sp. UNC300MFChir4.1 TaxID=1502747 RepID=UPI0008CED76D|nr:hypothetical protein [Methylobacterium sp. UNC300MFChir4.1]SEP09786.1 hypothetical protein SAMN02799625_04666 [Methylobacterium sp. UNC300MFChir4.1]
MPDHRGQTYDPQEPSPRGGWFRLEERPYPERLDRAFRVAAAALGVMAAATLLGVILIYATKPLNDGAGYAWLAATPVMAGGLIYGAVRAIGMLAVGVYGTVRDGSEFVVDWRAVRHDLPLRRTWIVVIEGALLLAAGGVSLWGLLLFVRQGEAFGLAVLVVVQLMTYWPLIRRRIAAGRTRG